MIDTKELRRLAQAATPGPWINHGRQPNVAGLPHSAVAAKTLLARVYSEAYGDVEQETANASFIAAVNPVAISELLDRLEAAEKERDALRSLVVTRFDHDYPPQFTQGHDLHELTEPVTAEHCRWFVAEIERLRTDCDALRAKIAEMEQQEPAGKFIQHPSNGLWEQDGYGDNPDARPLYALPGAKGE